MKQTLQHLIAILLVGLLGLTLAAWPAVGQSVIETEPPQPVPTDESVTLTFFADRGDGELEGFTGDVYAHTGVFTDQSPTEWTCVKNFWPTQAEFSGERDDVQLERIADDVYELTIEDIRDYYNANETGCTLAPDEEITSMNFTFRSGTGTPQTEDLFVDVLDLGGDPTLLATLLSPDVDPPLNPFIAARDTTVEVTAIGRAFNGATLSEGRLFVNDTLEDTITGVDDTLRFTVNLNAPGRIDLRVEVEGEQPDGTALEDAVATFLLRAPDVVEEVRPPGVEDGITEASDSRVILSIYAPEKEFAYVIGDFNDWQVDNDFFMKRESTTAFDDADGAHFWVEIDGLTPGEEYAFQYFIDGEIRTGDPFSEKVLSPDDSFIAEDVYAGLKAYPGDVTTNLVSVFETGQPDFTFSDFQRPAKEELVVYELLLRDFNEAKTYASLIDELDYLESLGINAIELMPVANFDGNISWGYNPNFHLATEKSYGPAEDLKEFINEAHKRGIAVILDVVYNHATDRSPLILLEGNAPSQSRFVGPGHQFNVFNHLNHDHKYIQYWLDRANRHWLEAYNVDGFRFDLTKGFVTGDPNNDFETGGFDANAFNQRRVDNLARMADAMQEVDESAYIILEHFQRPEELALAASNNALFWNGMNGPYREVAAGATDASLNGTLINDQPFNAITYMESHDEQWLMRWMKAFGVSEDSYNIQDFETALDRSKLAGAFFLTVPGPRMLWQLGEVGYGWNEGECLKPGDPDNDGDCSPDDPGRTDPKPVRAEYRDDVASPERTRLRQTWSELLRLRDEHEVFRSMDTEVSLDVDEGSVFRQITLEHPSQDVVIAGNFGVSPQQASIGLTETGTWHDFFNNAEVEVGSLPYSAWLQPGEFRIFMSEDPGSPVRDDLVMAPDETLGPPQEFSFQFTQTFDDVRDPSNYRLVGLPGLLDIDMAGTLTGDAGRQWRAFQDDGSQENFLNEYTEEAPFSFGPGKGFWLISEENWSVEKDDVDAPVFSLEGATTIDVHAGWNIISNPMDAGVDWQRVQTANDVSQSLWAWTGMGYERADTFESAAVGGSAYYYFHPRPAEELVVPYPGSVAAQSAARLELPADLQALRTLSTLSLSASVGDEVKAQVRLGLSEGEEVQEAAPRASFASLAFAIDATEGQPAAVTRLVPEVFDGHTFDLSLKGPRGADVVLTAEGLEAFGSAEVRLFDPRTERMYDLRTEEAIRLQPDGRTMPLQLLVGSREYVEQPAAPDQLTLKRNYPNPFAETTTIEYAVPEDMPVRIEVFDVLGRQVATLTDGHHRAGTHDVRWEGRDGSGGRVASGVYLVRLTAGSETKVKRITLVR